MYKVFVNNKLLCFVKSHVTGMDEPDSFVYNSDENNVLSKALQKLGVDNKTGKVFIAGNKSDERWTEFSRQFKQLEAAGGIVRDNKGNILMIYRFEKWDLPKGKKEKGETAEETALREVSEECGIGKCNILREIATTYHTYNKLNTHYLKRTWWYEMTYFGNEHIRPQIEEGITDIKWMSVEEVKKVLHNSYASIRQLLGQYLSGS